MHKNLLELPKSIPLVAIEEGTSPPPCVPSLPS